MKTIYGKLIQGFVIALCFSFFVSMMISNHENNQQVSEVTKNELYKINEFIADTIKEYGYVESDSILEGFGSLHNIGVLISFKEGGTAFYGSIATMPETLPENLYKTYIDYNVTEGSYDEVYYYVNNYVHDVQDFFVNTYRTVEFDRTVFLDSSFTLIICILVYGCIIFLIIVEIIVKPIRRLIKAQILLGDGDFTVRVSDYGQDEVGKLSDGFNDMVEKLEIHEESRKKFISDVSHEFQTPLTIIQGFAKIIKEETISKDDSVKYADIILHSSERLTALAKDMMLLTAIENNYYLVESKKYCVVRQLSYVVDSFEKAAQEKKLKIEFDRENRESFIIADQFRVEQVWVNLISNAIKYSSDGIISIDLKRTKQVISIIITDCGIGMSKDEIEKVYDRFYRVDESRTIEGTGLGMSIVKSIVDAHNGKITIKSKKGKGTKIIVQLPIKQ